MRNTTALAALFYAGLATGPALASSTTIIDFTIEISDNFGLEFDHLLFQGTSSGDEFDGFLEVSNSPVNVNNETAPLFLLESFTIEGFDPVFFAFPVAQLYSVPLGDGLSIGDTVFGEIRSEEYFDYFGFEVVATTYIQSEFVLMNDVSALNASDFLLILTGPGEKYFDIYEAEFYEKVRFEVTSASIRPDTTVIPLPAAGWMMIAGLGGLAALRRRA